MTTEDAGSRVGEEDVSGAPTLLPWGSMRRKKRLVGIVDLHPQQWAGIPQRRTRTELGTLGRKQKPLREGITLLARNSWTAGGHLDPEALS